MLRLFILTNLFLLNLFACKGGYDSCKAKLIDSNSVVGQTLQIPISNYKRLVYSKVKPKGKILKQDIYLNLYVVKTDKYFKFPFRINNFLSLGVASVTTKKSIEVKVIKPQIGLNHFAKFREKVSTPSLLTNSCCALEGIITGRGIIQKDYIERFLKTNDTRYSDIGIRLYNTNAKVKIKRVNPFIKNNPFKNDDIILSFDGKKVTSSSSLMKKILFSKVGSKHKVKVKRGSKTITIETTTYERIGGGYKSDTFLESKGLYLDKNLVIFKLNGLFKKYGLKVGDKLLKVNNHPIPNIEELGVYLKAFNEKSCILFERDGFQFFININS